MNQKLTSSLTKNSKGVLQGDIRSNNVYVRGKFEQKCLDLSFNSNEPELYDQETKKMLLDNIEKTSDVIKDGSDSSIIRVKKKRTISKKSKTNNELGEKNISELDNVLKKMDYDYELFERQKEDDTETVIFDPNEIIRGSDDDRVVSERSLNKINEKSEKVFEEMRKVEEIDLETEEIVSEVSTLIKQVHEADKLILSLIKNIPDDAVLAVPFKLVIKSQQEFFKQKIWKNYEKIMKGFDWMLAKFHNGRSAEFEISKRTLLSVDEVKNVISNCIYVENYCEKLADENKSNKSSPKNVEPNKKRRKYASNGSKQQRFKRISHSLQSCGVYNFRRPTTQNVNQCPTISSFHLFSDQALNSPSDAFNPNYYHNQSNCQVIGHPPHDSGYSDCIPQTLTIIPNSTVHLSNTSYKGVNIPTQNIRDCYPTYSHNMCDKLTVPPFEFQNMAFSSNSTSSNNQSDFTPKRPFVHLCPELYFKTQILNSTPLQQIRPSFNNLIRVRSNLSERRNCDFLPSTNVNSSKGKCFGESEVLDPTIPQKLTMKNQKLQAGNVLSPEKDCVESAEIIEVLEVKNTSGKGQTIRKYVCAKERCMNIAKSICEMCRSVVYCSKKCQESHWKMKHSGECVQLRNLRYQTLV